MTHLTRETHRPDSQYTGGPLFILRLHTRAANSQDTIDQRVLMLGRCDRMGRVSPWLPAAPTFPRRYKWRARKLVPPFHTQKKESADRKGKDFTTLWAGGSCSTLPGGHLPGHGSHSLCRGFWFDDAAARGARCQRVPRVLCVSRAPGCCPAARCMPLLGELRFGSRAHHSAASRGLAF